MELLSVIRRWRFRDHFSIRAISRRTGLSRNTVRRYLRSDSEEPKFSLPDRPSKLDPHADKLSHMLRQEAGKSRKQKRTVKQLHADLTGRVEHCGIILASENAVGHSPQANLVHPTVELGRASAANVIVDRADPDTYRRPAWCRV